MNRFKNEIHTIFSPLKKMISLMGRLLQREEVENPLKEVKKARPRGKQSLLRPKLRRQD